jgi:hypothetical protein
MNVEFSRMALTLLPNAAGAIESMTGAMLRFIKYANAALGGGGGGGGAPAGPSASGSTGTGMDMGGGEIMGAGEARPTGIEGLRLKHGAEKGGSSSDTLYAAAQQVHAMLGGDYKYFSGFNDKRSGTSAHNLGRAFDIVLNDPSGYQSALGKIQGIGGIKRAEFERAGQVNSNGSVASADHIHAEVSAANGAILSGPRGGYRPNLTMHGTEALIPLNSPAAQSMGLGGGESTGLMAAQLEKLEEMVSVMKNQLAVSTKIMQYAS